MNKRKRKKHLKKTINLDTLGEVLRIAFSACPLLNYKLPSFGNDTSNIEIETLKDYNYTFKEKDNLTKV